MEEFGRLILEQPASYFKRSVFIIQFRLSWNESRFKVGHVGIENEKGRLDLFGDLSPGSCAGSLFDVADNINCVDDLVRFYLHMGTNTMANVHRLSSVPIFVVRNQQSPFLEEVIAELQLPRYTRERVMFWHPRAAAFDPSLKYATFIAELLETKYGNIIPRDPKKILTDFCDLWESEDNGQREFVENLLVQMRSDIESLAL